MITTHLPLTIVAAVARNGVIGRDNRMPWTLPGDLAHFRSATLGKPVLMGRATFDSIGRALPGRAVVVLSRDAGFSPPGVEVARGVDAALLRADAIGLEAGAAEIILAGGGALYAELIARTTTLLLTEVDLSPDGETVFPKLDPAEWQEIERIPALRGPGDSASYAFVRYRRQP